jgi:hypothetical protein
VRPVCVYTEFVAVLEPSGDLLDGGGFQVARQSCLTCTNCGAG